MATAEAFLPLMRSSSYELLPSHIFELRVVLLGNSWFQRSLLGNLLLNSTAFDPGTEPQCSETARGPLKNKTITVINTPDLLHPNISEDRLTKAMEMLSKPGPHMFLLVLAPEDFTEQQQLKLQSIIEQFREKPFDHSIVLITTDTEDSASYLNNVHLETMIQKCRYRHMCLKKSEEQEGRYKNFKLAEFLARLGQVAKENNGERLYLDTISPAEQVQKALPEQYPCFTNLRILLFGKSEGKKELLRDVITESSQFSSSKRVVTTPDLFSMPVGEVKEEIKKCVSECSPGPNVVLVLVKPSDFTEKNRETLNLILTWFGPRAFQHCIVIFTDHEPKNECVRKLLGDCEFRYYEMFEENLSLLMEIIQFMMQRNSGSHVSLLQSVKERLLASRLYRRKVPPSHPVLSKPPTL